MISIMRGHDFAASMASCFTALDDRDALYYLALDFELVAEPHALHVLPFCGRPGEAVPGGRSSRCEVCR